MNSTEFPKDNRQPAIRVMLLPRDTNAAGTIFGGIIMSYIDLAGAVEAGKHTQHRIVTVAMDGVVFKHPVRVGELVSFYSLTVKLGNTSVRVHIDVEVDRKGEIIHVTKADLTFVSVDSQGTPIPLKS